MANQPPPKLSPLRVPPQDVQAEQALLGSIMLRPETMHDVTDIITAESFYSDKHRIIFISMLDLFGKSEPIDLLTVSSRLKEKKQLDQVGGSSYLSELVGIVPSASNVRHYAEIVHKKQGMRSLIEAAEHISQLGYDNEEDLESVFDRAGKRMLEAVTHTKKKFISIKDTLMEAWERLDRLHKSKDEIRGIPTGFPEIDIKLAGLQKSDLIILAARPSMGKTSLALDIARNTALKHGTTVGIFF